MASHWPSRIPKPLPVLLLPFAESLSIIRPPSKTSRRSLGYPTLANEGGMSCQLTILQPKFALPRDTKSDRGVLMMLTALSRSMHNALDCPPRRGRGRTKKWAHDSTRKPRTANSRLARSPSLKRLPFPFPCP
ncbi:hypothetical protein F5882DRAFT_153415 [Hyaloscypha sp. PMI_1271]|nr:hypothetical protein F5882DRAFT_153415 [Hyaloscypha sp. PMI_1271]